MAQGVIEVDVRGLDGRGMFALIDHAVQGAPLRTMVRVKVGATVPPVWIPWVQHDVVWQFVADNARVLAEWQQLAAEEVAA